MAEKEADNPVGYSPKGLPCDVKSRETEYFYTDVGLA
jgi:hypothetical protein